MFKEFLDGLHTCLLLRTSTKSRIQIVNVRSIYLHLGSLGVNIDRHTLTVLDRELAGGCYGAKTVMFFRFFSGELLFQPGGTK